jgi:hypothetical protein
LAGQIESSEDAVRELAETIVYDVKQVNVLNDTLSAYLKELGATFQDEGYFIVKNYVEKTQDRINEAIPHLKIIVRNLTEFADLLMKSQRQI